MKANYRINPDNGCWEWQGELNSNGYGRVWRNNKRIMAHRGFYELHRGPIPEGLELDHLCRNKPCVNPAHLEPVTHAENVRRAARATGSTVLSDEDINFIRGSVLTQRSLAMRFGVSQSTINKHKRGLTWSEMEAAA